MTLKQREYKKGELIISETNTSTWNYHLRRIGDEGPKFNGGAGKALCDKPLGWDVQIPLSTYGKKSQHIPEKYCDECWRIALAEGHEPC